MSNQRPVRRSRGSGGAVSKPPESEALRYE